MYIERWEQGTEFESKMASATNLALIHGDRIGDVLFLISLTHKFFQQPSSFPFLPLSCSFVLISIAVFALTFAGNTYLIKSLCIGFSEFIQPAMC